MTGTRTVRVARVYDPPAASPGARVLVDRIWPRGMRKEQAHLDEWCQAVAPSTALRTWYGHDPGRFEEFARRYRAELHDPEHSPALAHLRELAGQQDLTLLTAAAAIDISQAAVLAEMLREDT